MSRQIQIRRGTEEEHTNFTGAVGEITMDTTNKTLRIHDGETVGGTVLAKQEDIDVADYVIETQLPTAENNYMWFRKYKSGWIEQGGFFSLSGSWGSGSAPSKSIILPCPMSNNKYCITMARGSSDGMILTSICQNLTTTGFNIINYCTASSSAVSGWWRVEGF